MALDKVPAGFARLNLALDRGSVRTKDEFGRLHVAVSNISKANVCPYYGKEIPGSEALGLDPERAYLLWRDPKELEASVPSWNNLPLLDRHLATSADEPQKDNVIGSTGTDAVFVAPYLRNSLVVWDAAAIEAIENGDQRELSCGYGYVPEMVGGVTPDGERFDGRMTRIVGNHVTTVEQGRAGPDVLVGDRALKRGSFRSATTEVSTETGKMIKTQALPSRKALMVQGALVAHLAPRLAADAKIDLGPVLKGVNRANFKRRQPSILAAVQKATNGKLAADADLDEVADLLDHMNDVHEEGEDEVAEEDKDDKKAEDEETDEEKSAREAKEASDKKAKDEECAAKEAKDKKARDEAGEEDKVDKKAMDSAIAKAKSDTRRETMAEFRAISVAKEAVRPHIGEVDGDSATEIYKMALDAAIENGVELSLDDVQASAYPALVKLLPLPGSETRQGGKRLAADAASAKNFAELFPGAAAVRVL